MVLRKDFKEQRRYIRVNTVFPVEFRLVNKKGEAVSEWLQGFSHNISKGGICLFANLIPEFFWDKIRSNEYNLELKIYLPFSWRTITAKAKPIWQRQGNLKQAKFFIGVEFIDISLREKKTLIRFAYYRNLLPKLGIIAIIILSSLSFYTYYQNKKIVKQNQEVVKKLTEATIELSIKRDSFNQNKAVISLLQERIKALNADFRRIEKKLKFWEKGYERLRKERLELIKKGLSEEELIRKEEEAKRKISKLQEKLSLLKEENAVLEKRLAEMQKVTSNSKRELDVILKKKKILENVAIEDMYKWIKTHQNLKTGLIASFEGDYNLSSWAFSYDQALCVNVFLLFKDFEAAKRILDFYNFRAKLYKGGFLNAYYVEDGSPCEYIIHSGPNIWVGLSALRYIEATGDKTYLNLAERVAKFVLSMQDKEGGIIGGPKVKWYSTEHNLDAYAFFAGLYRIAKNKRYYKAKEEVENWLKKYSYTKQDIPINRGKGDSTIATDTYAWSIASLGPKELLNLEMDPDQIIKFAVENCKVKTYFRRNKDKVQVEGFDFSRLRNLPRGGVISCEWTAQMILALEIMAGCYEELSILDKSNFYKKLTLHYLEELEKMIISSPSPTGQGRGCLPYASSDSVDTGHGWRTPKGRNTCSLAATSYYIFAYYGYNPLNPKIVKKVFSYKNEEQKSYKDYAVSYKNKF